jgi:hypothetical protein
MKEIVRGELTNESYRVVEEPLFPPAAWISWSTYRPDLLGYRLHGQTEELVIVECETHPNMNRFRSKNFSSLSFQSSIFSEGRIRRILAVPQGKLSAVDLGLRRGWEVWVLGRSKPLQKVPRLG